MQLEVRMARWTTAIVAAILGMVNASVAAWPSADYVVSPQLSSASFTVYKWTVLKEQGWFRDISGRIHYDPARLQDSSVDVTIQTASLDTNNSTRDSVLRSDDFFDVQRYPTM
jgi:polyisoprenoid-binding protein YceI